MTLHLQQIYKIQWNYLKGDVCYILVSIHTHNDKIYTYDSYSEVLWRCPSFSFYGYFFYLCISKLVVVVQVEQQFMDAGQFIFQQTQDALSVQDMQFFALEKKSEHA